jgi:hypothetical protein
MKRFTCGLLLGVMLSASAAYAGYMMGFHVVVHTDAGDATCYDPYIYSGTKEISCDGELE